MIFMLACPMRTITSSTIITELMTTSAAHCATSFGSRYPKFAFRTLFVFCTLYEFFKFFIIFSVGIIDSILCAALSIMIIASTFQAIMVFACWALVIV